MTLIAFDLDGTLITCRERQCAVACNESNHLAAMFDARTFWDAKRHGATTLQALVDCGNPESLAREVATSWREAVEDERWLALDQVINGSSEVLRGVRSRGLRVWVLTARERPAAVTSQLRGLGLWPHVDILDVVSPHRAAYEKAALLAARRPLGLVGDTESDLAAAQAAGVACALVDTGQRAADYLRAQGARQVHEKLSDAVSWLASEPVSERTQEPPRRHRATPSPPAPSAT